MLKCQGFTLIELLVTVSIIMLLSGIIFANYRVGGQKFALQRSANKLAQDIRRIQQMAMSTQKCPSGTGCAGEIPPRYGIEFITANQDFYILFADRNPPDGNGRYETIPDHEIERIFLEQGVKINDLFVGDPPSSKTIVWITFKPPDPITEIRCPGAGGFSITNIQLIGANQTKTITVNKAGLIEIE